MSVGFHTRTPTISQFARLVAGLVLRQRAVPASIGPAQTVSYSWRSTIPIARCTLMNHWSRGNQPKYGITKDNEITCGMSEYEIVWEKIKDVDYQVAFGCKVGHQSENYALKLGSLYRLEVGSDSVSLIDRSIFGMKS